MELKTFVSTTLQEVCNGIADAQSKISTAGSSGCISPRNPTKATGEGYLEYVEFDVAVTATEGTNTSAGAGVSVIPFLQLGAKGASNESTSSVSQQLLQGSGHIPGEVLSSCPLPPTNPSASDADTQQSLR